MQQQQFKLYDDLFTIANKTQQDTKPFLNGEQYNNKFHF